MGPDLMRIPPVRTRGFTSTDDYTGNIERLVIPCLIVGYTLTIIHGKLSRQQTIEPVTFSLCILIYCPEVIPEVILLTGELHRDTLSLIVALVFHELSSLAFPSIEYRYPLVLD